MSRNLTHQNSELENYLENYNFPVERKGKELFNYWKNVGQEYLVNTSASLIFYNPANALTEHFFGHKTPEEIIYLRLFGSAFGLVNGSLYAGLRKRWAQLFSANEQSSRLKKWLVESSASGLFGLMTYPIILNVAEKVFPAQQNLDSNNLSAIATAVGFAAISGIPFGYILDKWRKLFGFKPLLRK